MSIDFHVVPTSGPVSGLSFEKQVEQAINELGAEIDNIDTSSQEAIEIAQNAQATANAAASSVNAAVAAANEATTAAQEATSVAATAQSTANAAATAANNAIDAAAIANTSANAATSTAQTALNAANGATSTASAAQDSASSAVSMASTAVSIATGNAVFIATDDAIDLNARFMIPEKLYLTNTSAQNLPGGTTVPFYISVMPNSSVSAATQLGWEESSGKIYIRTAPTVTYPDPPESGDAVANWGSWSAVGGDAGRIIGDIRLLPMRAGSLPSGWYFCNGDQFALTSAQGQVLNQLPVNFKTDWGIAVSGSNISLPNLFYIDGRGLFLRSVNGTTRQVGSIEQDKGRNVTGNGRVYGRDNTSSGAGFTNTTGALYASPGGGSGSTGGDVAIANNTINIDASRVWGSDHTGSEFTTLNAGMTPAIDLGA